MVWFLFLVGVAIGAVIWHTVEWIKWDRYIARQERMYGDEHDR
jgi:hypothetical protein